MKISIVGINGIGIAHAMAAERTGHEVVAVLDINPEAEEKIIGPWVNQWGPYEQDIIENPKSMPAFFTNVDQFKRIPADLLIIATPTRTHIPYLVQLGEGYDRILVEKPLSYFVGEMDSIPLSVVNKTFIGHEWLFHQARPALLKHPAFIYMGHGYPPEEPHKKECGIVWDLGVHALAELVVRTPIIKWNSFEVMWSRTEEDHASCGIILAQEKPLFAIIEVAYQHGAGMRICEKVLNWHNYLLEAQLKAIENDTHPADCAVGVMTCALAERIYSSDHFLCPGP